MRDSQSIRTDMLSDRDALRELIRNILESLDPKDVEMSRRPIRHDVSSTGMGEPTLVQLGDKRWLTNSQAEVDRVLRLGGRIVKGRTG